MPLSNTVLSPPPAAGPLPTTAAGLREYFRLLDRQLSVIEQNEEKERIEKDLMTNLAAFHCALGAAMSSQDLNVKRQLINTVADFAETLQSLLGQGPEDDGTSNGAGLCPFLPVRKLFSKSLSFHSRKGGPNGGGST